MKKLKKLLAYFGIFSKSVDIHGIKYSGVKLSKPLQQFYLNKNHEIEMFIFLKSVAYETMIDIGAYFGYFCLFFKKSQSNSEVVAFEADIDNFKKLKHFITLNKLNIKAFNNAVGDKLEQVNFFKPAYAGTTNFESHGQVGDPSRDVNNLYTNKNYIKRNIEMVPLKNILKDYVNGRTLLKLDIEGYEEKALRSVKKQLNDYKDLDLIVELMINDLYAADIFSFLQSCGYSAYLMTNAGLVAEDRPLVLPKANQNPKDQKLRTVWKNHFFTKRSKVEIKALNHKTYGYNI